jgi:diguanylate cyclase (GGDEF)-like protein
MSLRTVFLLCFAAACLPALGWSGWTALRAQSEWAGATTAVRAAQAMGDALHLVEALSIERGALQERALSDSSPDDLAGIASQNDDLLDHAQRSLRAAGLPDEAVTTAREMLRVARARVAEAIRLPLAQRDTRMVPTLMAQLFQRLDAVELSMAQAERGVGRANASIGALVAVGSLAVEMRAAAGRRSTYISGWMGGLVRAPKQLDDAMYMTGQVQHAWDRLQRQVLIVGEPARLAAAVTATRNGFFREAEPRYRELVALAEAGGKPPMSIAAFRRWTITALTGTLLARDAAITEALDYGTALAFEARAQLAIAAAATFGLLVLAGCAFLVLLRRLVLPVQHLTAAVTRLADGDVATAVPERGRRDEIGAMAAAIEVFRENAIARLQGEAALRRTNLQFDAALNSMLQGMVVWGPDLRVQLVNGRFFSICRMPPGSVAPGMSLREVIDSSLRHGRYQGEASDDLVATYHALLTARHSSEVEAVMWPGLIVRVASEPMANGGAVVTFEDVTEKRHTEQQIVFMARHDALTGLPNRTLLKDHMEAAVSRLSESHHFAVLCLDLDHFKEVNDTVGHAAGDELLRLVAGRLRHCVRDDDLIARLGGDEFAIVLTCGVDGAASATSLATRLIESITAPYEVQGHEFVVGASIGIALSDLGVAGAELLKRADVALYRAKEERGTFVFFEAGMDDHLHARRGLEADLRLAIQRGEFELYYQPLYNLVEDCVTGFEALLRWNSPTRGRVAPADFIPLAEQTGLIVPIGEWVVRTACAEAATWPEYVRVAVNLSPVQFKSKRLVALVHETLEETGLAARRLELEITETVLLQETELVMTMLHSLHDLGVRISMDDFGTGYSSLSYLRRFPFDKIKIDRSFVGDLSGVGDLLGAPNAAAGATGEKPSVAATSAAMIVRAITGLGLNLGMLITAEGVETAEQFAQVRREGCTEVQGYFISPPRPAGEVMALLRRLETAPSPIAGGRRALACQVA